MNNNNKHLDLLEFLKYILGCTYISDLKNETYNSKAKLIFEKMDLEEYSFEQIKDAYKYIYNK